MWYKHDCVVEGGGELSMYQFFVKISKIVLISLKKAKLSFIILKK